jgi:hypothetical protein
VTGEPTVVPLTGLLTLTVANAEATNITSIPIRQIDRFNIDGAFEIRVRSCGVASAELSGTWNKPGANGRFPSKTNLRTGIYIEPVLL